MSLEVKQIFVNLPYKDIAAARKFFTAIGFEFDERFSDDKTGLSLVLGPNIYAMLLTEEFFKTFTNQEITDTNKENEVINAISVSSKEKVDEVLRKALENGAEDKTTPLESGSELMYYKRFKDLGGHLWEIMYMDFNQFDNTEYKNEE